MRQQCPGVSHSDWLSWPCSTACQESHAIRSIAMKRPQSSSFTLGSAQPIELIEGRPADLQIQSFHTAINALSMARHYLLQGNEQAAESKASAALAALRCLLTQAQASGLPSTGAAAH
ncbi:hypothetical protein EBQ34_06990 [Vandammella animalimorsus]|uniref:Uncharacterized protein n=2 Tax=Vandammella animalimorsus TaxID=2029117 RepID=A0A3M6RJC3_9BURK|nr:hypothetical protein EBQ34_06990 [Vandammella animalimorsus]